MRSLFFPARSTEALSDQLVATGALGGYTTDPLDGDVGFVRAGSIGREVPPWTLDKQRAYSVAAYRANPMARAIIDTYVSFIVGDSGVKLSCPNPAVRDVATGFWDDPRVKLGPLQPPMCRDFLLNGESVYEMLVGKRFGSVRWSVIDPTRVTDIELERGNPLWPSAVWVDMGAGSRKSFSIVQVDELSGLRSGEVLFFSAFKALLTDRRGSPFLGQVLDDLDNYDTVLSNLVDRTALMRYIALDVTLDGADQDKIDEWVKNRGGKHVPASGTMEVHNDKVHIEGLNAQTGSFEDTNTAQSILTSVAGGAGLSKHWLAEPENSNRATSQSMAEPVRRRLGLIQNGWVENMTEFVRFAVDRAVDAGRLDAMVEVEDEAGSRMVPASQTVSITGPEIASADAQVMALVLANLGKALNDLVTNGVMTPEAAKVAVRKGWEDYVGVPYSAELDAPDGSKVDALAEEIDTSTPESRRPFLSRLG